MATGIPTGLFARQITGLATGQAIGFPASSPTGSPTSSPTSSPINLPTGLTIGMPTVDSSGQTIGPPTHPPTDPPHVPPMHRTPTPGVPSRQAWVGLRAETAEFFCKTPCRSLQRLRPDFCQKSTLPVAQQDPTPKSTPDPEP